MILGKHLKIKSLLILIGLLVVNAVLFYATVNKGLPESLPDRDSGSFLYTGSQILQGKIPYLEIWDHKPPIIFYINALGLLVGQGNMSGVWLLELIFSSFSSIICFLLIKKVFGLLPAVLGTILFQISFFLTFEGGNLTEEYAVPLQFLTLYLFFNFHKTSKYLLKNFLIGILFGVVFFLRQNLIAVFLAILIYQTIKFFTSKEKSLALKNILAISLGFLTITAVIIFYFLSKGAFSVFIDDAFRYNFFYSDNTTRNFTYVISRGIEALSISKISIMAILGFIELYAFIRYSKAVEALDDQKRSLFYVLLLMFPLEIVLATISGRTYLHYYLAWIPVMSLLAGFFVYKLQTNLRRNSELPLLFRAGSFILLILFTANIVYFSTRTFISGLPVIQNQLGAIKDQQFENNKIVSYIKNNTQKDDYVLMWGAEAVINFATRRRSPSRFTFQYPLFTPGYRNSQLTNQFFYDIQTRKPKYIIDANRTGTIAPTLTCPEGNAPSGIDYTVYAPEMDKVVNFICSHYKMVEKVDNHWSVFKLQ